MFARIVHGKRAWGIVLGLVLLAGIIGCYLKSRPPYSHPPRPQPAVVPPGSTPDEPPLRAPATETESPLPTVSEPTASERKDFSPPLLQASPDGVVVEIQPAAPAIPSAPQDLQPTVPSPLSPAESVAQIAAIAQTIQEIQALGPDALPRIRSLLDSADPADQVAGLASLAGLAMPGILPDVSRHPPEVVLAAVDHCQAFYGNSAAERLLESWKAQEGGSRTAGETAHTLLMEARLPYGGGPVALDALDGVLEQTKVAWLRIFANDAELPSSIRAESIFRLGRHSDPKEFQDFLRSCVEQASADGESWGIRIDRIGKWMEQPAPLDRAFIEAAFAQPDPGTLEDIGFYWDRAFQAGDGEMDAETAAFLRETLEKLDETGLEGPDRMALHRLLRRLDAAAAGAK